MLPDPSSASPGRGRPRPRTLGLPRRSALALAGALTALSLVAAACGEGDGGSSTTTQTISVTDPAAESAPSGDFMLTRPGAGIAAADGNPQAIRGDNPCEQPGAEPLKIAYVGANLAELEAIGLEALTIEEPGVIIGAYTNEVNFNGGINGHCVEFVNHLWSLADPASSFTEICTDMVTEPPLLYFALRVYEATLQCATIGARIPTIGLYTSPPEATVEMAGDRLFADDGSVEHLLEASLDVGLSSGVIDAGDRIGLLHGGPDMPAAVAIIERFGVEIAATEHVPIEYSNIELLLQEKQVRLLEGGLTEDERAEAQRSLAALPPELAEVYRQMESFFVEAATRFRDAGVTTVAATADWTDMRRMMRAAELVDWTPAWVTNDIQPSSVFMADIPNRQASNVVQISNRRAAGDPISELDRGCVTLRNTAAAAEPFAHRLHTDAWTLMTATCDYLDVAFSAMTRVQGEFTTDAFAEALRDTDYEAGSGGLITFGAGDMYGADRFRVLQADPDCVLNFWGCMRPTTDWMLPAGAAGAGAG